MIINKTYKKIIIILVVFGGILRLGFLALAGNPFYPRGYAYINNGGVMNEGSATTENSKATAISYRDGIVGQSMVTDQPDDNQIFPGDSTIPVPAYTNWDVGSSAWKTSQAAGQDAYIILETYAGMNGWTGQSYVAGGHKILTLEDISLAHFHPPYMIMELIPAPTEQSHTQTSITIQWTGLYDRSNVYPAGTWNDSIVGYTVYRSDNSTSTPVKIGTATQSAGGTITYLDSTVTQGVNYYYKLAVNYRWSANTPNPWYETTARGDWSEAFFTSAGPDAIRFVTAPITTSVGNKGGPITIESYNISSGDTTSTPVDVVVNLTSNSTGTYKFYAYTAGSCTSTEITQKTISAGSSSASFCYGDSKVGTPSITVDPTNAWDSIAQQETVNVGLLDHFNVNFAASQTNNVAFTGVNTITALDLGNNIVTGYDLTGIGVTISVANGATLLNKNLLATDFVNGVADVTAKGFKYTGPAGNIVFTATSDNGKTGNDSVTINVGSLDHIVIRSASGGGGSEIGAYGITTDNSLVLYAAGYDISNNFISDVSGTWLANGTLEAVSAGPAISTFFNPSLSNTSGTISFDDGGGHTDSTGTITVAHGALDHFVVSQAIGQQIAGVSFNMGQITAQDAENNTVESFTSSVSLSDTTGTINPTTSSPFTAGVLASQNVTITSAQSGVSIGVAASSKTGVSNNFTVVHNTLHHFALNFSSPQTNDVVFTSANTITAQDQWNNVIGEFNASEDNVVLTASSGGAIIGLGSGNNNTLNQAGDFVSGVADVAGSLKYTGASGSITFTATSQTTSKTGQATITINPGAHQSVIIRNAPNNGGTEAAEHLMRVGDTYNLYAAGYDISGNYTGDISGNWSKIGTLDAPASGASSTIAYAPTTALTSGVITFDDGSGHTDRTGNIVINRGPIDHFVLNFTSPQINGTAFTGINKIIAQDVGNNIITDYNKIGTAVTVSVSNGATLTNAVFQPASFISGAADLTAGGFKYAGAIGNILFTATSATTNKTGTATILINIGTLDHFDLSFEQSQDNAQLFTGTNTITAKDAGGNTITDFNALVDNVTISVAPDTGIVTGLGMEGDNILNQRLDFINGVADVSSDMMYNGVEGAYIFTATSDTGKTGSSNVVEISVGPLDHFGFAVIGNQQAGESFSIAITAYDISGNVKTSYTGISTISDPTGTVSPTTSGAFSGGNATLAVTITAATTTAYIHAVDSVDAEVSGNSNIFSVLNGALHHFSVSQSIADQTAGTSFDLGQVIAQDQWNNTVTSFTGTVVISDTTGTVSPTASDPFVAGILANQSVNITKAQSGVSLRVTSNSKTGSSNSFTVNPGALDSIIIRDAANGQGNILAAHIMTTDNFFTAYAAGYDANNNYIGDISGTWAVTGTLDALSAASASQTEFSPSTANTSGAITFDDGSGHTDTTGTITVNHGALYGFIINIATPQMVGAALSAVSTITAVDLENNIIDDFDASSNNITITADTGGTITGLGSGSDNILNQSTDFVGGVVDLSSLGMIYAGSTGDVIFQIESANGRISSSTAIVFNIGGLDHFDLDFYGSQKNGEVFTGTNTITAKDAGGNIITSFDASSDNATITSNPGDGAISGLGTGNDGVLNQAADFVGGVADVSGKIKFTGIFGEHTFTATSGTGKNGTSGNVDIAASDLVSIKILDAAYGLGNEVSAKTLTAGDNFQVWAAGYDASGNYIQDVVVSWIGTGAVAGNLSPVNGNNTTFSAAEPGTGIIFADIDGIRIQTGTITVEAGSASKVAFISYPYDGEYVSTPPPPHSNSAPLIAGQPSGAMVIQSQDAVGNVVVASSDIVVDLTSASADYAFSAASSPWSATGQIIINSGSSNATFYYMDNVIGTRNITASPIDNGISSDSQAVEIVSSESSSIVFTTGAQSITAGDITGAISIQLQDASGDPATSTEITTISLISNSPGTQGSAYYFCSDAECASQITEIDIPAGQSSASFYYFDTEATRSLITASASGYTNGYQIITISADVISKLFITPGPLSTDGQQIIQGQSSAKITVQAQDQYGNLSAVGSQAAIHLTSGNTTGYFAGPGTNGLWVSATTSPDIILSAGSYEAEFYYKDATLGEVQITASVQPELSWTDAAQIETIIAESAASIAKLSFITPARTAYVYAASQVITVQTQDSAGNNIAVDADTVISLITSAPQTGVFSLSPTGPWTATSVIITNGASSASFYYKDSSAGVKTLGVAENPSQGWTSAAQVITINAKPVSKLGFASGEQSIHLDESSSAITIQLQDNNGNPTIYASDVSVDLTASSATGVFATSPSGPWTATSVIIPAGSNSVNFYYKDSVAGSYSITALADSQSWGGAQQDISVFLSLISQIVFTTQIQSILADTASAIITIQTQDEQGNPRVVTGDTSIYLSSDSGSGVFSESADGPWNAAAVIIANGASSASFYYKDSGDGTFTITASESPEKGWTNGTQQIAIGELAKVINKLVFTTNSQTVVAGESSGIMTVQAWSITDEAINVSGDTQLLLVSNSGSGEFSVSSSGPWESRLIVTLPSGASSVNFYYRDLTTGTAVITVAESPGQSWTDATQSVTVEAGAISKLAFSTPSQSILKDNASSVIVVETQDAYGNTAIVSGDTVIDLSADSGGMEFSISDTSWQSISQVTILSGNSSASFYCRSSIIGSAVITIDESVSQNWNSAAQTIAVTDEELDHIVITPGTGAAVTNANFQFTAVGYNSSNTVMPNTTFTWSLTNSIAGTISSSGLFTSGSSIGNFDEVIKVTSGGKEATASINIFAGTTSCPVCPVCPTVSSSGGGGGGVITSTVPLNASVVINDGDKEVVGNSVKLNLYSTGASYVSVSNTPDFSDSANWMDYRTSLDWKLPEGLGTKIVYVKYKNSSGYESAVSNHSIRVVEALTPPDSHSYPHQESSSGGSAVQRNIVYNNYIIKSSKENRAINSPDVPHIISPASGGLVMADSIYLAGRAEPNTLVTLHIHSNNEVIAKLITNSLGEFIYKVEKNIIENGRHTVFVSEEKGDTVLVGPTTNFEVISGVSAETDQAVLAPVVDDFVETETIKDGLFDFNINMRPQDYVIYAGKSFPLAVVVSNYNEKDGKDVKLTYELKDSQRRTAAISQDEMTIEGPNAEFVKKIILPSDLSAGKYIIYARLNYDENKEVVDYRIFEVLSKKPIYKSNWFKIAIIILLILLAIIIFGIIRIILLYKHTSLRQHIKSFINFLFKR